VIISCNQPKLYIMENVNDTVKNFYDAIRSGDKKAVVDLMQDITSSGQLDTIARRTLLIRGASEIKDVYPRNALNTLIDVPSINTEERAKTPEEKATRQTLRHIALEMISEIATAYPYPQETPGIKPAERSEDNISATSEIKLSNASKILIKELSAELPALSNVRKR